MKDELIGKIFLDHNNQLLLLLESDGDSSYQYVYREAAGVYWDDDRKGFTSTPLVEWSVSDWYFHMKDVVKKGLGVDLVLSKTIIWENVPEEDKVRISAGLY